MRVTDEMVEAAMTVLSRYDKGEERLAMEGAIRAALAAAPIITPAITADKSPACPHIRSTDEGTHWCALAAAPHRLARAHRRCCGAGAAEGAGAGGANVAST